MIEITSKQLLEILIKKEELLFKIKELSKYCNKETIDYLVSLVMLNETVFRNTEFAKKFGKLDLFFEIAKYNIYNRTILTLENISEIDDDKLRVYNNKGLKIFYDDQFPIFDSMLLKEENKQTLPEITLYSINTPISKQIENIKNEIICLDNYVYSNSNFNNSYNPEEIAAHQSMFGVFSTKKVLTNKHKIEELEKRIENLKINGELQKKVCDLVTDSLLKDWNISFNEENIKKLSWINIYRKTI